MHSLCYLLVFRVFENSCQQNPIVLSNYLIAGVI